MWGCHTSYLFNGPKGVQKVPPQQWIRTLRDNQKAGLKHWSGCQGRGQWKSRWEAFHWHQSLCSFWRKEAQCERSGQSKWLPQLKKSVFLPPCQGPPGATWWRQTSPGCLNCAASCEREPPAPSPSRPRAVPLPKTCLFAGWAWFRGLLLAFSVVPAGTVSQEWKGQYYFINKSLKDILKNVLASLVAQTEKNSPGLGRFPEERNGNLLQYSCLENY